jgi:hypothetical protein
MPERTLMPRRGASLRRQPWRACKPRIYRYTLRWPETVTAW